MILMARSSAVLTQFEAHNLFVGSLHDACGAAAEVRQAVQSSRIPVTLELGLEPLVRCM